MTVAHPSAERGEGQHGDGYVAALDGVRALAIVMVLGVHAGEFFSPTPGGQAVMRVLSFGWSGVDLFFVLSGMLITGILLDTRDAPGYYRSFFARRALRIFPLYYAALAIFLIAFPLFVAYRHHRPPDFLAQPGWLLTYTTNMGNALTERPAGKIDGSTFPFWSLAVEEQFYLVWPFVVARLSRRALARTAGAMIVVALLLRTWLVLLGGHPHGVYETTPARMDALAAGALIAILARSPGGLARVRRFAAPALGAALLAFAGVVVASGGHAHEAPLISTIGFTLLSLGAAALLVLVLTAAPGNLVRRALELRPLRHLGARSYGVYVWHAAVFSQLAGRITPRLASVVPWPALQGVLGLVIGAGATLAVAEVSWTLLEAPMLRLKRFIPRPAARATGLPPADAPAVLTAAA